MSQTPDMRPQFWLTAARRDENGNWSPVSLEEVKYVENGFIRLKEVPELPLSGIGGVTIPGLVEVRTAPSSPNTFRVNYSTGRVYFNEYNEGHQLTLRYNGIGSLVATDEINYLYNKASEQGSFVGLTDTADTLIPNAYLRTDSRGKMIYSDAATVGRATSSAIIHDFSKNDVYTRSGTAFDTISVYKRVPAVRAQRPYTMKVEGGGSVVGAVWTALAVGESLVYFKGLDLSRINDFISVTTTWVRGDGLRFVINIRDKYYRMTENGLLYIGAAVPTDVGTTGNDISELANLSGWMLAPYAGETINFYFSGQPGAVIWTTWTVDAYYDGGWAASQFNASYDVATLMWNITAPTREEYMIVFGSGRDDLECTADVFDFSDIAKSETVTVYSPVRTAVNVLYTGFNTSVPQTNWPTGWSTDLPADLVTRVPNMYYGICSTDMPYEEWIENSVPETPSSIMDTRKYPAQNQITHTDLTQVGNIVYTQGFSGPAAYMSSTGADSAIVVGNPATHTGAGMAPFAIAGLFRYVSGSPIILSPSDPAAIDRRSYRIEFTNSTTLTVYLPADNVNNRPYYTRTYTVPADAWVYIAICHVQGIHRAGSHSDTEYRLNINGDLFTYNFAVYQGNPTFYAPNAVGNNISRFQSKAGVFMASDVVAYDRPISDAESTAIRAALLSRSKTNYGDGYVTYTSEHPFFDDGVTSMVRANSTDVRISFGQFTRYYFTKDGRYYTFSNENVLVEIPVSQKSALYSRGITYDRLISLYNTYRADVERMNLNAVVQNAPLAAPGMGFEFLTYQRSTVRYTLAKADIDAKILYNDQSKSWEITSLRGDNVNLRVAVLGASSHNVVAPISFSELIDTTTINESTSKTLVAYQGRVEKRPYLHPYLLGG